MYLDFSIDLMKEYLYARQQWYTYQQENKGYTRKDKEMTKHQIDSLKVALHVLREKRREIEKDGKSYWPYLPS
jgi:hypothetical protein